MELFWVINYIVFTNINIVHHLLLWSWPYWQYSWGIWTIMFSLFFELRSTNFCSLYNLVVNFLSVEIFWNVYFSFKNEKLQLYAILYYRPSINDMHIWIVYLLDFFFFMPDDKGFFNDDDLQWGSCTVGIQFYVWLVKTHIS